MVQLLPQPSTLASQAKRHLSLHVNRLPLGLGASLTNCGMKSRKSTRLVPLRRSLPLHFRRALADATLFSPPAGGLNGYKDARLAVHSKKTAHTRANANQKMACGDGFGSPNRGWIVLTNLPKIDELPAAGR